MSTDRLIDALELDAKDIWNNVAQFSRFSWERCGLVYGDLLLEIPNIDLDPRSNFSMAEADLIEVFRERGEPDAYWHSHPSGTVAPSDNDLRCSREAELDMVILTVDAVGVWSWSTGNLIAKVQSPYILGR